MTQRAAFQACFCDWRLIKGRKVVQVIFEVPLEGADAAYKALGGMPDPGKSVWCGIARLRKEGDDNPRGEELSEPQQDNAQPASVHPEHIAASTRARKSFHEMSPAQQTGILRHDPLFQKFIWETHDEMWRIMNLGTDEQRTVEIIHALCRVASCADIHVGTPAASTWSEIVEDYRAWVQEPAVIG